MDGLSDSIHYDSNKKPTWNLYQFGLSALCFITLPILFKLPIDHYFGSGWTLFSIVLFFIFLMPPVIYLQLRFGSMYNVGILGIMDRHLPLGLIFTIGCFLRNFIHVIYTSALISHCLTYIFFALYNCDGKLCIGGTFTWSSCRDAWAGGDCREGLPLILISPTAEEKFYQNFMFMQNPSINSPIFLPDWFQIVGLIAVPYTISWILLFLIAIGGAKVFGKILYLLIPLGTVLMISIFIYVTVTYSNEENQRSSFFNRFFTRFPNSVPVLNNAWDQYAYEPLIWGFLTIAAHLSIGVNLWNGIYPIMGKWIGNGKRRTHFSWIIIIIVLACFVTIPTLLNVAFLSSSFSELYLRCHVVHDWAFPFTVVAHVFTKFASHKALVLAYYIAILCFLLSAEGLILVASLESIIDHLQRWHHVISTQQLKSYRIACFITVLISYFLGFTTILKSGYYWIYLMDFYVDRLMCLMMVGQCACFIVIYALSKPVKYEGKWLKICFIIFSVFACLVLFTVLIWFSVDATGIPPSKDCPFARISLTVDPIPSGYAGFGWFIAACPILIGLFIGPILIYIHSKRNGSNKFLSYLLHGDQDRSMPYGNTEDVMPLSTVNKQDTMNMTIPVKMKQMKGTLQSSAWPTTSSQRSRGDVSEPSAIYFNEEPNIMYDQRQSIRRPLVSPDPGSDFSTSHEYAKINKTRRRSKPDFSELDV